MRGRTIWFKQDRVEMDDLVPILRDFHVLHEFVTLMADVMFGISDDLI